MILGTVQLGMPYGVSNALGMPAEDEAMRILGAAQAAGVRLLDTAASYGESEARIGRYLSENPDAFGICTKLPIRLEAGGENVHQSVCDSLERLCVKSLSVCYLHRFEQYRDESVMLALERMVGEGLVERIGVSIYHPAELKEIAECPRGVSVVQIPCSPLAVSRWKDALAVAEGEGIVVYARSVYLQGLVFQEPDALRPSIIGATPWLKKLRLLADEKGYSIAAYCWGLVSSMCGIKDVVIGSETVAQVEENAMLGRFLPAFTEEEIVRIVETFEDVPELVVDPSLWPVWE